MWKYPWRYAEGIAICVGLFATGLTLQFAFGAVPLDALRYPVNIILGGVYLLVLFFFFWLSKRNKYVLWFSKSEAAITAIAAVLILVIVMGFTRQQTAEAAEQMQHNAKQWSFGFRQMTRSWSFALLYVYFLSILGLATLRRLSSFKRKDFTFAMNHLGLFITMFAGVLGSPDMQRLRMQTQLSQPEWRAMNDEGALVELPLAIELQSFNIEEYPPKLLVISNKTGDAYPKNQPHNVLVEQVPIIEHLMDWKVQVSEFLPMAAAVATQDTIKYVNFETHGATSAVYVKATKNGISKEGWVSAGNHMFPHKALKLDADFSIVMPEREHKKYVSEVAIYTKSGEEFQTSIEVNKPFKLDGWKIYQLSYDETMGRWSNISIFELVKDPWLPYVYFGIALMLIGAVSLFLIAKRKES